jgi:hypothetical protein
MVELRCKEVDAVIKKARAASAPGLNGSKRSVEKWTRLSDRQLGTGKRMFYPKKLNAEEKIFLAVLARRMNSYLLANSYIDRMC